MKLFGKKVDVVVLDEFSETTSASLEDLWNEAARLGSVQVYGSGKGAHPSVYRVTIIFETVPGVELKAASEFDLTPTEAFAQAIERAKAIVKSFSRNAPQEADQPSTLLRGSDSEVKK